MAERQVAALLACGGGTDDVWSDKVPSDAELHAATFAPATGALLWSAPLGGRSGILWDARADFVSADPVVVAASASGDSDSGAYFSFGGNGRPNPPIDFSGPYGEIPYYERLKAVSEGTRLDAPPRRGETPRYYRYRLTTFDLATGIPVWGGTHDDDRLDGATRHHLLLQDGKLTVPTSPHRSSCFGLRALGAATGEQRDARSFPDGKDPANALFEYRMHGEWFDFGTLDPVQTITHALSTGAVAVPEEPPAEAVPEPPPFDELALFRSTLTRLYGPGATFILWEFAEQAGWSEQGARKHLMQLVENGYLRLVGRDMVQSDWVRQKYKVLR
ncbi:hypothetical protein [Streptomyces sp. NPDC051921]|uniref:hypothetical protein n=1 Tax=Streptomyces sp. NPDC051921 TaxID=3155806 RepID=UPI00341485A6